MGTLQASIVIPAFNQTERLELTLLSLNHQSSSDFEVIVADHGPMDNSAKLMDRLHVAYPLRYLRHLHAGRAAIRNRKAQTDSHKILVFCDSDGAVCNSFVADHLNAYKRQNHAVVIMCALPYSPVNASPKHGHHARTHSIKSLTDCNTQAKGYVCQAI